MKNFQIKMLEIFEVITPALYLDSAHTVWFHRCQLCQRVKYLTQKCSVTLC